MNPYRLLLLVMAVALASCGNETDAQVLPGKPSYAEARFQDGSQSFSHFVEPLMDTLATVAMEKGPPFNFAADLTIDKEGCVTNVEIYADIPAGLKQYIKTFWLNSPRWRPAISNGKYVASVWRWRPNFCFSEE